MYDLDRMNLDNQVDSGIFGISKGSRFDHQNQHWLLFDDYISTAYSYMSFVIKQDLEQREGKNEENLFDKEAYNYLFNSRSSFMDGEFVRSDT